MKNEEKNSCDLIDSVAYSLKTKDIIIKPEIKGYYLSDDYEMLWNLINSGYRVPGYVLYHKSEEKEIWDLVEIKTYGQVAGNGYTIGTRGICYESFSKRKEQFFLDCKKYNLQFIKHNPLKK